MRGIIIVAMFLAGCGAGNVESATPPSKAEEAIPVQAVRIETGEISNFVESSSTVAARYHVDIYPRAAGEVVAVCQEEGTRVEKGETLARLDRVPSELDLAEAQTLLAELAHLKSQQQLTVQETVQREKSAALQVQESVEKVATAKQKLSQIETELNRTKAMLEQNLVSREAYEAKQLTFQEAQSSLKTAELALQRAKVELQNQSLLVAKAKIEMDILEDKIKKANLTVRRAEIKLEETDIRAPIAGLLSHANAQVGEHVHTTSHLFTVVDTENLEVKVGIPQRELLSIRERQKVRLFTESTPLQENCDPQGEVKAISPVVQKETGTVKVTITILSRYVALFRPGMFVTAQVITDTHPKAVLIPKKALLFEDNIPFVFLLQKDRAKKVLLYDKVVGFKDKVRYEVLGEIHAGDFMIVVGQSGLKDNALVRVVGQ